VNSIHHYYTSSSKIVRDILQYLSFHSAPVIKKEPKKKRTKKGFLTTNSSLPQITRSMTEAEQEEKIKTQLQVTRQRIAALEAAAAAARASASSRKADMQEELQRVQEQVACLDRVGRAMDALGNKLDEAQGGGGCVGCSRFAFAPAKCPVASTPANTIE
jgi:hypothetical protein